MKTNLQYFNAGTFMKNDNQNGNPLGLSLFIKTIESNPEDYFTWLRIGEWLVQLTKNNKDYYLLGVSCLKKAFSLFPDSQKQSYSFNNSLIDDDIWKNQIEANIETLQKFKISISTHIIITEYNRIYYPGNINIEGRTELIKRLSETKDILFLDFLKYIIENESVFEIKIAALKRLIYFKNLVELKDFFIKLSQNHPSEIEPFLTLALYDINEDWAKELLNKNILNKFLNPFFNLKNELDEETKKLIEEISYPFEYNRFRSLIIGKKYDRLSDTLKRSDIRVCRLQEKNILNIDEELTDYGIHCLEKYISIK